MRPPLDAALGAALVMFWSSGFVGAELGTHVATADTLLAWRYGIAAILLAGVATARGTRITAGALMQHGLLGLLCQCIYLGGVFGGVSLGVAAGTTALIAATQPMLVAAVGGPMLGEYTSPRVRLGLTIGLVGVGLVVAGDVGLGDAPWWAFLLPVGGTVALTAGTLLERRWRPAESPLDALTIQTVFAAGVFLAVAGAAGRLEPPADPQFWWAIAWVVVLSSFGGYGVYLLVLRRSGALRTSTLLYLTPPTTIVWAFLMFGEVPGPVAVPGVVVCALGVALALKRPRAVAGRATRSEAPRARTAPPRSPAPDEADMA